MTYRNNRYTPYYRKTRRNIRNNNEEEQEDNQIPNLLSIFTQNNPQNNPFKNLFGGDDTDVYCENNHIFFKTDVNQESINKLCSLLRTKVNEYTHLKHNQLVDNINFKPIYLHISSYGGLLHEAFLAYDYIKASPIPIYTVVEGYAASAATILSIAGNKRFITRTGIMLIHQLSTGMEGRYQELEEELQNSKQLMNKLYSIYVLETKGKMTKKQVIEELKHDKWWNADKCINKGLCDDYYKELLV